MNNVGFIGAGKVSCSIGKYLSEHDVTVTGYYDVSEESANEAATFTNSHSFKSEAELIAASDIIFIATPDDIISKVWETIKTMDINGKVLGIFSGSLSSSLFSGIEVTGASAASIHPMYAFSDKYSDYKNLHTAPFTIEGNDKAVEVFRSFFMRLGHMVTVIDAADKVKYHAAASVASNLMVGLYDMSLSMLTDCGFTLESAKKLLAPLINKNTQAMLSTTPALALTGPIERGDTETVDKHLHALTGDEKAVYIPLAKRLIEIAKIKNPDRSYDKMLSILNNHIS